MTFKNKLRAWMKAKNYTKWDAAIAAGVSYQSIHNWSEGRKKARSLGRQLVAAAMKRDGFMEHETEQTPLPFEEHVVPRSYTVTLLTETTLSDLDSVLELARKAGSITIKTDRGEKFDVLFVDSGKVK